MRNRPNLVSSIGALRVAAALLTLSPAWAQSPPAEQATTQTETASTADAVVKPKSLDHITISGARESASTRLPLTPRENPQSTNTVDRAQMERQSLTSIDAVLRNVTGIAVSFYDTQRPLYYARGFQITDFKVDGLPTYSGGTNQEYDTALYERIDVVRGANGILTAIGVPSATVDMIRKRPQREFAASVALTAGSWNLWRGELDLNTPLTSDGSVRSRLVVAPQTKESFRDRYQEDKTALLAAIEADLGNATVATVGFQRQRNVPEAPIWGTIPRFAADGGLANLPVSTSFSPSWTRWERTVLHGVELGAGLGKQARRVVGADQVDVDHFGKLVQRRGFAVFADHALGGADACDLHQDAGGAVGCGGCLDGLRHACTATPPISAATRSALVMLRSSTVTLAPRRASSRAVASPKPEPPPVTNAACP
eukprot:gene33642-41507_t